MRFSIAAGVFLTLAASPLYAQSAYVIFTNGKIITVDEKFTIAQTVAVRGDRIVAVATNQEVARLVGPNTRKMVGGTVVNRQPISREDALIAHTRRNAFFVFQETIWGRSRWGRWRTSSCSIGIT